jgi:hypothetical protein
MMNWRKFSRKKLAGIIPLGISEKRREQLEAESHTANCFKRLMAHEDWPAMDSLLTQTRNEALNQLAHHNPQKPMQESDRVALSVAAATIDNLRLSINTMIKQGELADAELARTKKKEKSHV